MSAEVFHWAASIASVVFVAGFVSLLYVAVPIIKDAGKILSNINHVSKEVKKDVEEVTKKLSGK